MEDRRSTFIDEDKKGDILDSPQEQRVSNFTTEPSPNSRYHTAQGNPFATPRKQGEETDYNAGVSDGRHRTVGERLESTLTVAKAEQDKYARRAQLAGMAVTAALFSQIVVNALVTGLSAVPNNRHAQIGVSALGAIGTVVASFLVRVRGTREPERSASHAQNLEKYIRELEAFVLDEGLSTDRKWDWNVKEFRLEFDHLQTAAHQSENGQPMRERAASNMGDLKTSV